MTEGSTESVPSTAVRALGRRLAPDKRHWGVRKKMWRGQQAKYKQGKVKYLCGFTAETETKANPAPCGTGLDGCLVTFLHLGGRAGWQLDSKECVSSFHIGPLICANYLFPL